jgi:hypothetical protein
MTAGRILSALLMVTALSCGSGKSERPVDVSLIQLIASPDKFDSRHVMVMGFARLEFEGNALYLHEEDYKRGLTKNAVWVDVPPDIRGRSKEYDMKYVLIVGTFSATRKGHMGLFSGTIERVESFRSLHVDRIQQPVPPIVPNSGAGKPSKIASTNLDWQ